MAAKLSQTITPLPSCLLVGMRCLWWCLVLVFHQTWPCALQPNWLLSSLSRTEFQKSCGLIQIKCFVKLNWAELYFFRFSPGYPSIDAWSDFSKHWSHELQHLAYWQRSIVPGMYSVFGKVTQLFQNKCAKQVFTALIKPFLGFLMIIWWLLMQDTFPIWCCLTWEWHLIARIMLFWSVDYVSGLLSLGLNRTGSLPIIKQAIICVNWRLYMINLSNNMWYTSRLNPWTSIVLLIYANLRP